MEIARVLLVPTLLALAWVGMALVVHLRGSVRLRFSRQLLNHSTFMAPYNLLCYAFSAVGSKPILDAADFPELRPLQENWQTIRDEARELLDRGELREAESRNDIAFNSFFRRGWKRFYLKWYDQILPSAAEHCPQTAKLVQQIPEVNAALFALLPPGGKLGEHRDPFAGSLRYHLGLVTPNSDACRIYVDGQLYWWRDGEHVVFDETYIHSARNDTDTTRIILFCDVTRPLRSGVMRSLNRFVSRNVVKVTSSQNVPGERLGTVNRIAGSIYAYHGFTRRLKATSRPLYYAGKYLVIFGLVAGLYLLIF